MELPGKNAYILFERVLKQIIRDRRTFLMLTFIPILITLIFGYAIGGQVIDVPVVVVMKDTGAIPPSSPLSVKVNIGKDYVQQYLSSDERVAITTTDSLNVAKMDVDNGKYVAMIFIPENFSLNLFAILSNETKEHAEIVIYLDGTRPTLVQGIMASLQGAINSTTSELARISGKEMGVRISQSWSNDISDLKALDVAIPGTIALILNFLVILISTLMLVRENTYRTKARLLASPIKPSEIIIGYSLALLVLATIMSLSVLLISVFIFNARVSGDFFQLFICIEIYASIFVFCGVFLSNFARNELQAIQMGPLIAFPSMALSGFLVPVEILPEWLRPISSIIPMTYGVKIFQGIMLKSYSILDLWQEFLIICFFAVLFLFLAIITMKGTTE